MKGLVHQNDNDDCMPSSEALLPWLGVNVVKEVAICHQDKTIRLASTSAARKPPIQVKIKSNSKCNFAEKCNSDRGIHWISIYRVSFWISSSRTAKCGKHVLHMHASTDASGPISRTGIGCAAVSLPQESLPPSKQKHQQANYRI